jgi:ribosome-associated translation inhibitor RaiA
MHVQIVGHHLTVTDAIRSYVEQSACGLKC